MHLWSVTGSHQGINTQSENLNKAENTGDNVVQDKELSFKAIDYEGDVADEKDKVEYFSIDHQQYACDAIIK